MEFDAHGQDTSGTGNAPSTENVNRNSPSALDQITGNVTGAESENSGNPDRGDIAESESGDFDFRADAENEATESSASTGGAKDDSKPRPRLTKKGEIDKRTQPYSIDSIFNPRGKHPFLTDAIIDDFCDTLKTCIFQELAAVEAGIAPNSLKEWLRQGRVVHEYLWDALNCFTGNEETDKAFFEEKAMALSPADWMVYRLYTETKKAVAEGERDDLDFIARARAKDWKAAAYRLKIRNRKVYGEGPQVEVTNNVNTGDTNVDMTVVDYAQWVLSDEGEAIEVEATVIPDNDNADDRTTDV